MHRTKAIVIWLTTPSLLHGVVVGVFLSIIVALAWQFALARVVLALLLACAGLLIFGAIIGIRLLKHGDPSLHGQTANEFARTIESHAQNLLSDKDEKRQQSTSYILHSFIGKMPGILSGVSRFFAIGQLFALVGVVVSFSIFLATYLQADRLADQNRLIQLQSLSAHQQISLQMRSESIAVETLGSLASELLSVHQASAQPIAEVEKHCDFEDSDWRVTLEDILQETPTNPSDKRRCFTWIATYLNGRSENLEANRLVNQQIEGSGLRIGLFSRDLTEQFTSQFSSLCDTNPSDTTELSRLWAALQRLEQDIQGLSWELAGDADYEILNTTPFELANDAFSNFLSLAGVQASTTRALWAQIRLTIEAVDRYLEEQRTRCIDRSKKLRNDIELIDLQFDALKAELNLQN